MPKRKVTLVFPPSLIKEPVIYRMSKDCHLIPNIKKARVTESEGEVVLELEGSEEQIQRGVEYLTQLGVKVEQA
ncbi:MAG: NIL domain-containing protein [candidate division NC10 bacterium]|nr:NIL domain-containing protein [candidate division NC10 bacterium]